MVTIPPEIRLPISADTGCGANSACIGVRDTILCSSKARGYAVKPTLFHLADHTYGECPMDELEIATAVEK